MTNKHKSLTQRNWFNVTYAMTIENQRHTFTLKIQL